MATVDGGGGGHGGKKNVDQEIPLIPFIDLLFCCVMFLLATAVWNKLARIDVNQRAPGTATTEAEPPPDDEPPVKYFLKIKAEGYELASSTGDNLSIPTLRPGEYDVNELDTKLRARRQNDRRPNKNQLTVQSSDDIDYIHIIEAMDLAVGHEYTDISLDQLTAL